MDKPKRGVKPDVVYHTPDPPDDVLAKIDEHLSKPWTSAEQGQGRTYATSTLDEIAIRGVIKFYQGLGWDVRKQDDQREGAYLVFRKPTPVSSDSW